MRKWNIRERNITYSFQYSYSTIVKYCTDSFCVKIVPSSNDSENIKLILRTILRLPLAVKTDFDDQWFHFDYKSHK